MSGNPGPIASAAANNPSRIALPGLKDVRGGSNVQTSSSTNVCGVFNTDHDNGIIKGVNTCLYNKANPQTSPTGTSSGSSPSSTSGGSSSSNAAVANFHISAPLTGLSAFIGALLFI